MFFLKKGILILFLILTLIAFLLILLGECLRELRNDNEMLVSTLAAYG